MKIRIGKREITISVNVSIRKWQLDPLGNLRVTSDFVLAKDSDGFAIVGSHWQVCDADNGKQVIVHASCDAICETGSCPMCGLEVPSVVIWGDGDKS